MTTSKSEFDAFVSDKLDEIKAVLKPDAKITLLIRVPTSPASDTIITEDDLLQLLPMIQRGRLRDGEVLGNA